MFFLQRSATPELPLILGEQLSDALLISLLLKVFGQQTERLIKPSDLPVLVLPRLIKKQFFQR